MTFGNANAGTVEVDVEGNYGPLNRGLKAQGTQAGTKFGSSFSQSFGSTLAKVGGAAVVGSFVKSTINASSDLAEAVNVTGLAFGESRRQADEFAKSAADAIGMSEADTRALQAQLGNVMVGFGAAQDEAVEVSEDLIRRAADIGSAWNAGTDEVTNAIISGFTTSTEPLRRFGVIIDQQAIKARALELGLMDAGGEMSNYAKQAAVTSLVMEQTDNVAGDFQNTQDGLANSTKTVAAMWEDMQAQLGTSLLPTLELVLGVVRSLGPEGMKTVLLLGTGILVFTRLAMAARAFSAALTLLAANPWVLAALAIIAVGVAIWRNWDTVKEKLGAAWDFLTEKAGAAAEWIGTKWLELTEGFERFRDRVTAIVQTVGEWIDRWLISPVQRFIDIVTALPELAGSAWDTVKTKIGEAAQWIKTKLEELAAAADRALGPLDEIIGGAANLVGRGASLLGFDTGGVVPGPRGAPRVILAHGGETILPTHREDASSAARSVGLDQLGDRAAGGGNTYITVELNANGVTSPEEIVRYAEPLARELDRRLRREKRANGQPEEAIR